MNDRDNGPAYWWARHTPYSTDEAHHDVEKVVLAGRELLNAEWNRNGKGNGSVAQGSANFNDLQQQQYQKTGNTKKYRNICRKIWKREWERQFAFHRVTMTKGICFKQRWFCWWVPKIWQLICQQVHLFFCGLSSLLPLLLPLLVYGFCLLFWPKGIAHFRFGVKMKITTLSLAAANLMTDKYAIIFAQFVA